MAFAIWITGLPGSGKSTIAKELAKLLNIEILRMDTLRKSILPDYNGTDRTLTEEELSSTYRAIAQMAHTITKYGKSVIIDSTDSTGAGRALAKQLIKDFFVVQLKCPLSVREKREAEREDKAGIADLYKKARAGKLRIPGLGKRYVEEKSPLITIHSDKTSPEEAASAIVCKLKSLQTIQKNRKVFM